MKPPALPSKDAGASRLLEILMEFAKHRALTASQLTRATGIPTSAVYRHLAVLVQSGLVAQTARRGRYSAGPETLRLSANFRHENMVKGRITDQLQLLSDDTRELAAYLVVSGTEALCVEAVEGPQMLRCSYSPGRSQPLHRGASAVALLAHSAPDARDGILNRLALAATEQEALSRELDLARGRGFAVSYGAIDAGVWGVSVPVFDESGGLLGAVSTMAPAERASRREKHLIDSTRDAALALGGGKDARS